MFTIKYRQFQIASEQPCEGPTNYDAVESLHGPYADVFQNFDDGGMVVYAHDEHGDCKMTFGPCCGSDVVADMPPRPTLWVMNPTGATVATYRL